MLPDAITSGALGVNQSPAVAGVASSSAVTKLVAPEHSHLARRQQIEPLWLTEKKAIEAAIEACDSNVNRAAGLLEIAPSTLYRKLQSWKKLQA
jgi:two-component system repressor protein LuxO